MLALICSTGTDFEEPSGTFQVGEATVVVGHTTGHQTQRNSADSLEIPVGPSGRQRFDPVGQPKKNTFDPAKFCRTIHRETWGQGWAEQPSQFGQSEGGKESGGLRRGGVTVARSPSLPWATI